MKSTNANWKRNVPLVCFLLLIFVAFTGGIAWADQQIVQKNVHCPLTDAEKAVYGPPVDGDGDNTVDDYEIQSHTINGQVIKCYCLDRTDNGDGHYFALKIGNRWIGKCPFGGGKNIKDLTDASQLKWTSEDDGIPDGKKVDGTDFNDMHYRYDMTTEILYKNFTWNGAVVKQMVNDPPPTDPDSLEPANASIPGNISMTLYEVIEIDDVPAITPPGFLLALLSLFGLAAIAMRKMYKR